MSVVDVPNEIPSNRNDVDGVRQV